VRTGRWKYIRRFEPRSGPVLANCDDGPSKEVWLDYGWQDRPPEMEQLYDLIFDPSESANLADRTGMAETLNGMRARLERWMEVTDDPLLDGPVAAPPGTWVNDADDRSPSQAPQLAAGHD
jgi:hypothetical protein